MKTSIKYVKIRGGIPNVDTFKKILGTRLNSYLTIEDITIDEHPNGMVTVSLYLDNDRDDIAHRDFIKLQKVITKKLVNNGINKPVQTSFNDNSNSKIIFAIDYRS